MFRRAQVVLWLAALVAVALASSSAGQGPPSGSPPGLDKAKQVKDKHAEKLLDTPGIAGIGVGVKQNGKAVIRIYKEKDEVAGVPESLDDVPVESVTTGILEPRAPTDRFPRPVPIGVSSGHFELATGTLGARVTDGTSVYALSNNHVYAGVNSASIGDPILQPGPIEDGGTDPADRIGTLFDYQEIDFAGGDNTMDAAIALTSLGDVGTATPPDGYGSPSTTPTAASIGQAVQKYGRTTGLQLGTVADINLTVDVCYFPIDQFCLQEARFVNQFSVTPGPFSAPGDSGSLIVTQGGNQPVGLLFAGGDGLTIGNPIDSVLQRFNVTIQGGPPASGPPSAPLNLQASAGDDLVSLTWNAPAFDGGSEVSSYAIHRGTSPTELSFLTGSTTTSFVDASAQNGTTYYYKVSALNANGEGPLSNQASATPNELVPPNEPLSPVDDFNRPNENPLSGGWMNGINGSIETGHFTTSNQLACSKTTTCSAWRNAPQYGPDVEVWARLPVLPGVNNQLRLLARLQGVGTSAYDGYMVRPNQLAGTDQILFERVDNGVFVNLLTVDQELAAGDLFLLRVEGSTLEAWRHDGSAWSRLGTVSDSTYTAVGHAGVGLRGTTGRVDDFGARTMGAPPPDTTPPSAPGTLSSSAFSSSRIDLSWGAATDTGGVTLYRIERCSGLSCANFTEIATVNAPATSYQNTGLDPSTSYTYRVRAEDAALNQGPYSNVATSSTPSSVVPPVEPLIVVDDFNRGNENPLSGGGSWSNGIGGLGETGLRLSSNTLACARSGACSAWRNTRQYGPDVEVYARVSTLPGRNNDVRLLARVQQPESSGYDAYVLRAIQRNGTDEVHLERVDNGAVTNLVTIPRELAAGDVLLLRAIGTRLEAWMRRGSTWSLVGAAEDTTYTSAGYAGVGIRGKTCRLDDFGAR